MRSADCVAWPPYMDAHELRRMVLGHDDNRSRPLLSVDGTSEGTRFAGSCGFWEGLYQNHLHWAAADADGSVVPGKGAASGAPTALRVATQPSRQAGLVAVPPSVAMLSIAALGLGLGLTAAAAKWRSQHGTPRMTTLW